MIKKSIYLFDFKEYKWMENEETEHLRSCNWWYLLRIIHLLFLFSLFIPSLIYKDKKEKDLSQRLENRIERNNSSQLRWIRIEDIPRQAKEAGRISG